MKNKTLVLVLFLEILLISACSSSSGVLTVQDAWARPAGIGENTAAYFTIDNGTGSADRLLSANSDVAAAAEMHMSMADENGVMSTEMQDAVQIPARDKIEFKPGRLHVMRVDIHRDLNPGDIILLTLHFQIAGDLTVEVSVQEP